jgi:hypothetical protein
MLPSLHSTKIPISMTVQQTILCPNLISNPLNHISCLKSFMTSVGMNASYGSNVWRLRHSGTSFSAQCVQDIP